MFTVMVVDDNESIRRGVALVLREGGFHTVTASDGAEAIELTESNVPDLMLLDVSMPVLDGLSLLEFVRDQPGWESLPVLMYSAVDDPLVRRRAERLGAGFVSKGTASWQDLVLAIQRRLQQQVGAADDAPSARLCSCPPA